MGSAFILMLGLSLAGGATCLLVFACGALVRNRLRSSWIFHLWLIVLLCFIIPVPLNLPVTSSGFQNVSAAISSATVHEQPPAASAADAPAASSALDEMYAPENDSVPTPTPAVSAGRISSDTEGIDAAGTVSAFAVLILRFLPYVWLAGASAILLWTATGYVRTLRRLCRGRTLLIPGRVPVYENSRIATPLLAGILRPAVYLPVGFPNPALAIHHELTHLRRGDIWLKWLIQLTVCVHWFNPLVWLMKRELNRLCELACDKAAVRGLCEADRRTYGFMLLDTASAVKNTGGILIVSLGRDKQILQERLCEIMKSKKASRKAVAAMWALFAVILSSAVIFGALFSGCTVTPAASEQNAPGTSETGYDNSTVFNTTVQPPDQAPPTASPSTPAAAPSADVSNSGSVVVVSCTFNFFSPDGDTAVIGTWQLVDVVDGVSSFEPGKQQYAGEFNNWKLYIGEGGTFGMSAPYSPQAEGKAGDYLIPESEESYEIKELDGATYMFTANKSGGSTSYSVWEKTSDSANLQEHMQKMYTQHSSGSGVITTAEP